MSFATDVLIIGNSLAAYAAAYWTGKAGIQVALAASDKPPSSEGEGIATLSDGDTPQLFTQDLVRAGGDRIHQRAIDLLIASGPELVKELLIAELKIPFELTEEGRLNYHQASGHSTGRILSCRKDTERTIAEALIEKIKGMDNVKIMSKHTVVELITLDHSQRAADSYKRPACCGAYVLDRVDGSVSALLAKETVVATRGFDMLFYDNPTEHNDGLGLICGSDARVIHLFHLCRTDKDNELSPPHSRGGAFVEKDGQTSVQRLRVLGEWACTGVQGCTPLEGVRLLESLVWAKAASDEIIKHVSKFIYYTPSVKKWEGGQQDADSDLIEKDWQVFQQILWSYVGSDAENSRIARALPLLDILKANVESSIKSVRITAHLVHLKHAILATTRICASLASNIPHRATEPSERNKLSEMNYT